MRKSRSDRVDVNPGDGFSSADEAHVEIMVVCQVKVRSRGGSKPRVDGTPAEGAAPRVERLEVVRLAGEAGLRLAYCDADERQVADAVHASLAAAMQQAYFEFGIGEEEWEFVPVGE